VSNRVLLLMRGMPISVLRAMSGAREVGCEERDQAGLSELS
jgi:hypothetical protein